MFTVQFETDNAAFSEDAMASEIGRILRRIAQQVEDGATDGRVLDVNGNRVGRWEARSS